MFVCLVLLSGDAKGTGNVGTITGFLLGPSETLQLDLFSHQQRQPVTLSYGTALTNVAFPSTQMFSASSASNTIGADRIHICGRVKVLSQTCMQAT